MITKLAPVVYDPPARCPNWLAFLDMIMLGRQSLVEFLKRALGSSLTGITSDKAMFILYGPGGYQPITIRWKLTIVRRFYEAARNVGLRPDNPAAGVKSPRVRQATEDFNYLSDEELGTFLATIPDPDQATGREKVKRPRQRRGSDRSGWEPGVAGSR